MKRVITFIAIFLFSMTSAEAAATKTTVSLPLGESSVRINVYENRSANVTFFAPHYNEQFARNLAREYVERSGGRLVEIESTDEKGNPIRHLKFALKGKIYTIDPNRIYTDNGRSCGVAPETGDAVRAFAESLLKILFAEDGKTLRTGERFLVAVHNNTDVDTKAQSARSNDLTAVAFVKNSNSMILSHGEFEEQADGVFLSNAETDADNFIFLSTPAHVGYFAERGFNVVVQKPAERLRSKQCTVDDGSMSVYSALAAIPYICLEADAATGMYRQRQMLDSVYQLLPEQKPLDPTTATAAK